MDEREPYSLSFAKKAAAFFKMARSISSSSTFFRSAAFSRSRWATRSSGASPFDSGNRPGCNDGLRY